VFVSTEINDNSFMYPVGLLGTWQNRIFFSTQICLQMLAAATEYSDPDD